MNKRVFSPIFKIIINFVVSFLLIINLYGADPEVKFESFNKNSFDQVFSRADRLGDRLQWQQAVESGKKAISAKWEADAVKKIEEILKLQPDELKKTVENKLRADMAVAKTSWEAGADQEIVDRKIKYISKKSDIPLVKVNASLIKKALKDAAVNNNTADFNTDLSGWDSSLTSLRSTQRSDVVTTLNNKIIQLKSSSGLNGSELAKYHDLLRKKADNVLIDWDLQADYLIIRDRNKFVAKRLYDRNSLKLASEKTSAEYIVNNIIQTTSHDAKKKVTDALKTDGASIGSTPNIINLNGLGENWQQKIQTALKSGLDLWEKATKDVLAKFDEWRKTTEDAYALSDNKWVEAYNKLKEAKENWQNEINGQIKEGLKAWDNKELELLANRQDAEKRLDEYMTQQNQEWTEYSGQLANLFNQGSSAINSATENIKWLEGNIKYLENNIKNSVRNFQLNPENFRADYISWTNQMVQNVLKDSRYKFHKYQFCDTGLFVDSNKDTHPDVNFSTGVAKRKIYVDFKVVHEYKAPFITQRRDNNSFIHTHTYSIADTDDFKNYTFYKQELARWKKIMADFIDLNNQALTRYHYGDMWKGSTGMSMLSDTNDAYLYTDSEFDLEKKRRELSYWQNQMDIADAVYSYATNTSASKESADQTAFLMHTSLSNMKIAQTAYSNAQDIFNNVSISNLSYWRNNLSAFSLTINESRINFQEAKKKYDEKLALLRLLQNEIDSGSMAKELGQIVQQYEAERKNLVVLQSNYSMKYAELLRNENRFAYADILVSTASNSDQAFLNYSAYTNMIPDTSDIDSVNLYDIGMHVVTNLTDLLPEIPEFETELWTQLTNLDEAVDYSDEIRAKGMILSTLRRIDRVLYSSYATGTSNISFVLSPESISLSTLSSNLQDLDYLSFKNRAENNYKAVDFVYETVSNLISNDANTWLTYSELEDLLLKPNRLALNDYMDDDLSSYNDGDGFNMLLSWYSANSGMLLSASNIIGFADEDPRAVILSNLEYDRNNAFEINQYFLTNELKGEDRLVNTMYFMDDVKLISEERIGGFQGISLMDADLLNQSIQFAGSYENALKKTSYKTMTDLFNVLNETLDSDDFGGKTALSLVETAEELLKKTKAYNSVQPAFLKDALTGLETLINKAKSQMNYFKYKGDGKTIDDIKIEITSLSNEFYNDNQKVVLATRIMEIMESGYSNTFELLQASITNESMAPMLLSNPENLSNMLYIASETNKQEIIDAVGSMYLSSSSNSEFVTMSISKLNSIKYIYENSGNAESFREILKEAHIIDGTDKYSVTRDNSSLDIIYENWESDTYNGRTDGKGSKYNYAYFDTDTADYGMKNSFLDSINNIADALNGIKNGILPAMSSITNALDQDTSSMLGFFTNSYSIHSGYTNAGGRSDILKLANDWKTASELNNTFNNSDLSVKKSTMDGASGSLDKTKADMLKKGRFVRISTMSANDFQTSAEFVTAKNDFNNKQTILDNAQNSYNNAKTEYDKASTEYYSSMTNTSSLETEYLKLKKEYDKRAAVYNFASTPYSETEQQDWMSSGSTNSASDVKEFYDRIYISYTNAKRLFNSALATNANAVSLSSLTTDAKYSSYQSARNDYIKKSESFIRFEKASSYMKSQMGDLGNKIAQIKQDIEKAEKNLFTSDYLSKPAEQQTVRDDLLMSIITGKLTETDYEKWLALNRMNDNFIPVKMERSGFSDYFRRRARYLKEKVGGVRGYFTASDFGLRTITSGSFSWTEWGLNDAANNAFWGKYINPNYTATSHNAKLFEKLSLKDNGIVNNNIFADMIDPFRTMQGYRLALDFAQWEVDHGKGGFLGIRRAWWRGVRDNARKGRGSAYLGYDPALNMYNVHKNTGFNIIKDVKNLYSKYNNLQNQLDLVDKLTVDKISFDNGFDLSKTSTQGDLKTFQSSIIQKLQAAGLKADDYDYISSTQGLTNLSEILGNTGLNLVRKTEKIKANGCIEKDSSGNIVYEYVVSTSRILEIIKSRRIGERQTSLFNLEKTASEDKTIDNKVFIRDKEKILYDLAIFAKEITKYLLIGPFIPYYVDENKGMAYNGFVKITEELTGVGNQVWSALKNQEKQLQLQKWDFKLLTFKEERNRWESTASDIYKRGQDQWLQMERKFSMAWSSWRDESQKKINEAQAKWQKTVDDLTISKNNWLKGLQNAAATSGAEAMKYTIQNDVKNTIDSVTKNMPGNIDFSGFDADKMVNDLLRENKVSLLSTDFMGMMNFTDTSFVLSEITAFSKSTALSGMQEKLTKFENASSLMHNMRIFDTLNKMMKNYTQMITEADNGTRKNIGQQLKLNGFDKSGNNWTRRAIVDASLVNTKYATQKVTDYSSYKYQSFDSDIKIDNGESFSTSIFKTMSATELESLVTASKIKMERKFDMLMNDDPDNPSSTLSFAYHIGKAPETDDEGNPTGGNGQLGIVFTQLIKANKIKAEGEAKAYAPLWDKQIIPGGPSLAAVAKIGVGFIGGPWASFAFDAMSTAIQVATGGMDWDEGLLSMGKSLATTAVSQWTGDLSKSWGSSFTKMTGSGVIGSTIGTIASTGINQAANIAISGFNLDNGWGMSENQFDNMVAGGFKSMAIGGATALASGIVNSAMGASYGEYKVPGKNGTQTGWNFKTEGVLNKMNDSMLSIGNTVGALAGQGLSAAYGDGFTLNLLNTKDIFGSDNNFNHQGLLEFKIGGKGNKGTSLSFGSGGADVSASMLGQISEGMREFGFQSRVNNRTDLSSLQQRALLSKVNMQRWSGNKDAMNIAEMVVDGEIGVQFGEGNQAIGGFIHIDENEIQTRKDGQISLSSQIRMATIGAHEGKHILDDIAGLGMDRAGSSRDRLLLGLTRERRAHTTGLGTYSGLMKKFGGDVINEGTFTDRDKEFGKDMKGLATAMANGQLNQHILKNYDITGMDWKRSAFQNKSQIPSIQFDQKSKTYKIVNSTMYNTRVSMEKNDKIEDLLGALGADGLKGADSLVRPQVVSKLQETFPDMKIDSSWSKAKQNQVINQYLGKLGEGDLNVSLSYDGNYSASAGMYDGSETRDRMNNMFKTIDNSFVEGVMRSQFDGANLSRKREVLSYLQEAYDDNMNDGNILSIKGEIPNYRQYDYPNVILGNSSFPFSAAGCAVTAAAMYGSQVNPDKAKDPVQLNKWLKDNNGFSGAGLIFPVALNQFNRKYVEQPLFSSDQVINRLKNENIGTIIELYNPNVSVGLQTHFVVISKYIRSDNAFISYDPGKRTPTYLKYNNNRWYTSNNWNGYYARRMVIDKKY